MAKAPAKDEAPKNAVVATGGMALPAHLQGKAKEHKIGNVDSTDLIVPRVKLMQKISPELEVYEGLKAGRFFHNVANVDMGPEIDGIPILMTKTYVLWAPRNDDRGILARASDGVNWDIPGLEFEVKPKGSPNNIKYKLGKTVHDRPEGGGPAMSEFGSSIPGDPQSAPAAALTYQFLWYFPDFPHLSPSMILNTRSSVKPGKGLLSKLDHVPVDHYYAKFRIGCVTEKGDEGDYFNYSYTMIGYADEEVGKITADLFKRYEGQAIRANDEDTEADDKTAVAGGGRPRGDGPKDSSAF